MSTNENIKNLVSALVIELQKENQPKPKQPKPDKQTLADRRIEAWWKKKYPLG